MDDDEKDFMIEAKLGTEGARAWYNDWLWYDIDYHDEESWNKTKKEIKYCGLDMEAAYHAGYQAIKKYQLTNIDLRHKIEQLEMLVQANVQVMKLEIKKELEDEASKSKE